jgi:hypothetical protein
MKYQSHLRDGRLCWTLTSNGYKYLTLNLYKSWTAAIPHQPLLVVCADAESHLFFQREYIPCVMATTRLPNFGPRIREFNSETFQRLNALKLECLAFFAKESSVRECIYLDGDIVVYKDFLPDMATRMETQPLWFQCDETSPVCSSPTACTSLCTGFIAFRHGIPAAIFELTDAALWKRGGSMDQPYVNERIRQLGVTAMALPADLYLNGYRGALNDAVSSRMRADAFLLHYNHMVGNTKVAKMRALGDWKIPAL